MAERSERQRELTLAACAAWIKLRSAIRAERSERQRELTPEALRRGFALL